jgi:hypothetical protein
VPRTTGPARDPHMVKARCEIHVEYVWTSWSRLAEVGASRDGQHAVEPAYGYQDDEGIAAQLSEAKRCLS